MTGGTVSTAVFEAGTQFNGGTVSGALTMSAGASANGGSTSNGPLAVSAGGGGSMNPLNGLIVARP